MFRYRRSLIVPLKDGNKLFTKRRHWVWSYGAFGLCFDILFLFPFLRF